MTHTRTLVLVPALALALLVLAPPASAATEEVQVYLHELTGQGFHLVPPAYNAKAGDTIRFDVINQGLDHDNQQHDFIVCGDGPTPTSPCNHKLAFTGLIPNNATAIATITNAPAGDFAMYCDIPGHAEAGMTGTLHVAGSGATTKASGGGALLGTLISLAGLALFRRHAR